LLDEEVVVNGKQVPPESSSRKGRLIQNGFHVYAQLSFSFGCLRCDRGGLAAALCPSVRLETSPRGTWKKAGWRTSRRETRCKTCSKPATS
jgi:hypothetical protein